MQNLKLPLIGAPMFLVSTPELVIAQCRAGIVGTFPALNARPAAQLDEWIAEIEAAIEASGDAAPYGVNLIVHKTNPRLDEDLAACVRHGVPLVITSVGEPSGGWTASTAMAAWCCTTLSRCAMRARLWRPGSTG